MFRGYLSTIRKEDAKNLLFPRNKEKHDTQLYNTLSQKCVTTGREVFLHSAKHNAIHTYTSPYSGRTLRPLMFRSKEIWGDGKEREERGPTKIHVQH